MCWRFSFFLDLPFYFVHLFVWFLVDEVRGQVIVEGRNANEVEKTFTFDTVFSTDSKQVDVYNLTARPIVDSVLSGYNG